MGLGHSPIIVLNGLVLALDAGNKKSYIGSGTTWTDLIGRGNTGTLTNGPTYSSTSGGSIVFNGTNHNVSIGTNGFSFGSSAGTLSAWAKTRDRTSTGTIVSYGSSVNNQARFLGVRASNFYFSGYGSSISASGLSYDTWFNLVGVYDGTNASMYVNGALVSGPTARSWATVPSNAGIGKNVSNNEYWQGDVAQVQIYNRALSAAEIQQNYNAFKGRYATYISGEEPTITVSVSPASTVEDGVTNLVYTFTSNKTVTNNVTVNYSISGTATNGVDYTTIGTSVVIPTGSSSATVTVNPTDDSTVESDETVILTLANGEYAIGSPSSATGTILNDDPTITVSVSPSSVQEDGTTNLVYTFTSNNIVSSNVTVNYSISGTATNGVDYTTIGTSVVIPTGSSSATVTVNPTDDSTVESDETVILTISSGAYTIGSPSSATGTIINDDAFPEYTTPGIYYWTCPNGVTSISVVCIGGGASGSGGFDSPNRAQGGGGGALSYSNSIPVSPGQSYELKVGSGGVITSTSQNHNFVAGGNSYFKLSALNYILAGGATNRLGGTPSNVGIVGVAAYSGGAGGQGIINDSGSGSGGVGGGAANYNSNGETGGSGPYGGAFGTGPGTGMNGNNDGTYGAGGNGSYYTWNSGSGGQNGAVRIIWGPGKSYPSAAS